MPDREKAIRILEGNYKNFVLRHNGELLTVNELIALLKAQEPRVMTLEEFNAHWQIPPQERKPIWEEWKVDNGKGKWKLYGRATGGYGDMWRCWTSRPDQATREAAKWDE